MKTTTATKSSKPPESVVDLPRHLTVLALRRTLGLAVALAALVLVFQALRLAHALPFGSLSPGHLARIALATLPAILTLTLPMAFVMAVAGVLGDARENGEITGLFALGLDPAHIVQPLLRSAVAVSAVVAVLAGWLGPWALDVVQQDIAEVWRGQETVAPTTVAPGQWLAVEHVASHPNGTVALSNTDWITRHQASTLHVVARQTTLGPGGDIESDDVQVRIVGETERVEIGANTLQLRVPQLAPELFRSPIPAVETWTAPQLLNRANGGDVLARGQLVKRLVLVLATVPLVLLLLALTLRSTWFRTASAALIAGLVLAAVVHGLARGGELVARQSVPGGLVVVAIALMACAAWGVWRLERS